MHGDIPIGNFVLKEDDYKNYSKNFILTETYIKGLFSTHVILFVGYSISDPNVKQIFNWINEILGEDSTPAFLISDSNSEYFNLKILFGNKSFSSFLLDI